MVVEFMMTLSLYHVILGRGDPLAEQLSRIVSPMFCAVIDVGGVEVKTGGSAKRWEYLLAFLWENQNTGFLFF